MRIYHILCSVVLMANYCNLNISRLHLSSSVILNWGLMGTVGWPEPLVGVLWHGCHCCSGQVEFPRHTSVSGRSIVMKTGPERAVTKVGASACFRLILLCMGHIVHFYLAVILMAAATQWNNHWGNLRQHNSDSQPRCHQILMLFRVPWNYKGWEPIAKDQHPAIRTCLPCCSVE